MITTNSAYNTGTYMSGTPYAIVVLYQSIKIEYMGVYK